MMPSPDWISISERLGTCRVTRTVNLLVCARAEARAKSTRV